MTVSTLKKKLVLQAIQTLRELNNKHYENSSNKKPLLQEEGKSTIYLQVMLKKIPKNKLTQMIKVNLPHSLVKDTDDICLITGDLDKKNHKAEIEPDVLHYKALLEKHGIKQVSQVMTLRQLRTEYKPFEAKQKLLGAYDVFLADNKIAECLPKVLGKHFFKKRKFPIQINLKTSNLKQQVEKALSIKVFYITGQGNSCTSEVAYLDMADTEVLENIFAVAEALFNNVPGSWCNIMGIYLKTGKSKAVPLYMSYDSPNSVQLPEVKEEDDGLIDELNTIPNVKVKVYRDGKVETMRVKDDMETSCIETQGSNIEENNVNSELRGLKNECIEMETDKEVKLDEKTKPAKQKKKNRKQQLISSDQSQQSDKEVKPDEETKPVKQKKKNIKQQLMSSNQSQQSGKEMKLDEETKSVKQKKKNIKQQLISSDQSQQSEKVKPDEETKPAKQRKKNIKQQLISSDKSQQFVSSEENKNVALKRKRVKSESTILDSEQAVNDNGTPMKLTKKRKIEGINMKRYEAIKESKKSKRKIQPRNKQRI